MTGNAASLKRLVKVPGSQPARNWAPEPYDYKELNSVNNLSELGSFTPRISRDECSPTVHFIAFLKL